LTLTPFFGLSTISVIIIYLLLATRFFLQNK
jgi:hypothetical protein